MSSTKVMSFELNGKKIKTTVTNEVIVINERILSFLQPTNNHGTKVIGFDFEWHPITHFESARINPQTDHFGSDKNSPPPSPATPATFQLCDGNSCLIIYTRPNSRVPLSLLNFLRQPNYTFVGCGIKDNFANLEKHFYGIGCKNAVDLGTLAATIMGEPHLRFCGVDELAFMVNQLDLRKERPINMTFDWGRNPLSETPAKLATINVYSYHKIGSTLLAKYRPQSHPPLSWVSLV
ncbi:hypothetical protein TSUD_174710 [Trifolium subterraneum]|uniref:3'-5' exonuclease domain-containing protein n=1 Tax=Trifolium subterraneum TaxID=3900 RepID=A0A2Z6NH82_TRISU|nr:hypothetical protein TSUD_174710 [Trifolium subterraneum]